MIARRSPISNATPYSYTHNISFNTPTTDGSTDSIVSSVVSNILYFDPNSNTWVPSIDLTTANLTVGTDGSVIFPAGLTGMYYYQIRYTDIYGNVSDSNDTVTVASSATYQRPLLAAGTLNIYQTTGNDWGTGNLTVKNPALFHSASDMFGTAVDSSAINNPLLTYGITTYGDNLIDTSKLGTQHFTYSFTTYDYTQGGQYTTDASGNLIANPDFASSGAVLGTDSISGKTTVTYPDGTIYRINGDGTSTLSAQATVIVHAEPTLNSPKDANGASLGNITLVQNTPISQILGTKNADGALTNSYAALLWNGGLDHMGENIHAYLDNLTGDLTDSSVDSTGKANLFYTGERYTPANDMDMMTVTRYAYQEADGTLTNDATTAGVANTPNTPLADLEIKDNLTTTMGYDSVTQTNDIPVVTGGEIWFEYSYTDPVTGGPVVLDSAHAALNFVKPHATGVDTTGDVNTDIPLPNDYSSPDLSADSLVIAGTGGKTAPDGLTVEEIINNTEPDAVAGASLSGFSLTSQDGTGSPENYSLYKEASSNIYDIVASSSPGEINPPAGTSLGKVTLELDSITGQPDGKITVNTSLRGQYNFIMSFYDSYDNEVQAVDTLTVGALTLDRVPNFNFGSQQISGIDQTYPEQTGNNAVQVTDSRFNDTGWSLSVSQDTFTKITTDSQGVITKYPAITLPNTYISFSGMDAGNQGAQSATYGSVNLTPDGTAHDLFSAPVGKGQGLNQMSLGNVELHVPSSETQLANTDYQANLTWTMSDTPDYQ